MNKKERGPWLTSAQAADYLGLTFVAFTRMRQRGLIPKRFIHRLGRRLRFKASELDELIKSEENKKEE